MTSRAFDRLFGGPPRKPESELTQKRDGPRALGPGGHRGDHAAHGSPRRGGRRASATSAWPAASRSTASPTARSCARGSSTTSGSSRRPATRAARSALRYCAWHLVHGGPRTADGRIDSQAGSYLGPSFTSDEIETWLEGPRSAVPPAGSRRDDGGRRRPARRREGRRLVLRAGWSSGRAPSAPAASSATLAAAKMQSVMNLKIKYRESFRPFAPACLAEDVSELFELDRPIALHAARGRRAARQAPSDLGGRRRALRDRQAQRAALGYPGRHARRLLGPRPDGARGDQSPVPRA